MKKISKNQVILKCHDKKAMTWDIVDINLIKKGKNFFNCSRDYCDYECYQDTDIANLSEKINNNWDTVKNTIYMVLNKKTPYEIAIKKKGFCMIIEPIFEGEEVGLQGYYYKKINEEYKIYKLGDNI